MTVDRPNSCVQQKVMAASPVKLMRSPRKKKTEGRRKNMPSRRKKKREEKREGKNSAETGASPQKKEPLLQFDRDVSPLGRERTPQTVHQPCEKPRRQGKPDSIRERIVGEGRRQPRGSLIISGGPCKRKSREIPGSEGGG